MKLLSVNQDYKTSKGTKLGYMTGIMYLAPSNEVKGINTCPWASKGCKTACLYTAGRGSFSNVKTARMNRTKLFRDDKPEFFTMLVKEITALKRKADKDGLIPVVRLNGTSDIMWENFKLENNFTIFDLFPDIQFYDYTKNHKRMGLPKNYHITFSRSESNETIALNQTKKGVNVAVVFNELPEKYKGIKVISGDDTDLRFLDNNKGNKGVIIGLVAKGKARKDNSGFVV